MNTAAPDHQRPPPDAVGQHARRQVGKDDGQRPREIQQRVLGRAQPQIEKENGEDRIIEARIEEHAEQDETPPIAIGIGQPRLLAPVSGGCLSHG